jgi:ankyrin repeat protein
MSITSILLMDCDYYAQSANNNIVNMKTQILKHFAFVVLIINVMNISACNQASTKTSSESMSASSTEGIIVDLHTALLKNDIVTVKKHIASKSDLNIIEPMGGSTPLISASLFGHAEIAKLLINAGAKLNVQNNDGSTALITAAFFGRTEIVNLLLQSKADKTIKNKYGQTA